MTDFLVGAWARPQGQSWRSARVRGSALAVLTLTLTAGCGGTGVAPGSFSERASPEALFLVHNELFSIRLDGTDRKSLGLIGDNKWRTGYPRILPDGRAIALGDENGAIFPYYASPNDDRMLRLSNSNVTINDSVCGVSIMGMPQMVLTSTPFVPTHTAVDRVDLNDPSPEMMHFERSALIANPAPYGDNHVVAVRYGDSGTDIVVIDVMMPLSNSKVPVVLTHVDAPYYAASPGRLPDGRVVYIRLDSREQTNDLLPGEMWLVDVDGSTRKVGIDNIVSLYVVEGYVVYEAVGDGRYSDIVATNFVDPPVNVTSTPYISEHIGWSD
jgi:hypothetical protein